MLSRVRMIRSADGHRREDERCKLKNGVRESLPEKVIFMQSLKEVRELVT